MLVGRGRQAVARRRGQRDALGDALVRARVVASGFELQAVELAAGAITELGTLQGGDRKVGEIHLVAAVAVRSFQGWRHRSRLRVWSQTYPTTHRNQSFDRREHRPLGGKCVVDIFVFSLWLGGSRPLAQSTHSWQVTTIRRKRNVPGRTEIGCAAARRVGP